MLQRPRHLQREYSAAFYGVRACLAKNGGFSAAIPLPNLLFSLFNFVSPYFFPVCRQLSVTRRPFRCLSTSLFLAVFSFLNIRSFVCIVCLPAPVVSPRPTSFLVIRPRLLLFCPSPAFSSEAPSQCLTSLSPSSTSSPLGTSLPFSHGSGHCLCSFCCGRPCVLVLEGGSGSSSKCLAPEADRKSARC